MSLELQLEKTDIDLNALFNLSYSFDNLKGLLTAILKNQDLMADRIKNIEETDKKAADIVEQHSINEKRLKSIEVIMTKIKNGGAISSDIITDNNIILQKKKEGDKKDENVTDRKDEGEKKSEENEDNYNQYYDNGFDAEQINKRIDELEKKMKKMELSKFTGQSSSGGNNEDIELQKVGLKSLEDKFEEIRLKNEEMTKQIEDLTIKCNDFNIYDLFKDAKTEGGNIDLSKVLIMNLEQKVFKKFDSVDEKIKKINEDMYKFKTDMQNMKNQFDVSQHSFQGLKDTMKELAEAIQNSNDENANKVNELEGKLNENYKKMLKKSEDDRNAASRQIENLKAKMNNMKKSDDEENGSSNVVNAGNGLSDTEMKFLKDLSQRVNDLEKNLKAVVQNINIEQLRDDLVKLQNDLASKTNQKDFYDLNDKVNIQAAILNNVKDSNDRLADEVNKNTNDLNFLLKKIESLNATVITLKAGMGETGIPGVQGTIFDQTKYLEVASFNDFLKTYQKEQNKIKNELDDIRKLIRDLSEILKTKASEEDMRNFETLMNSKLEELKLYCNRRFADKVDTSKSIKYLDAQIKHIVDVYIKRMEKGDNWLLAKKPIGGFTCASCEAYIGELKDKGEYMAWNKYPMREPNDKAYRIGNGFSRMLNMLNLDVRGSNIDGENYDSDNDRKISPGKNMNNSNVLPSIHSHKANDEQNNVNVNMSVDNLGNGSGEEYKIDDPNGPHM